MGKLERFYSQLERRIQASSTFVEPLTWEQLEYVVRHGRRLNPTPKLERLTTFIPSDLRMMALDPGQTTGFSYWVGNELEECGQQTISAIEDWLDSYADSKGMDQLIFENYRVYGSRMKVQGTLYTPRLIGRIESWADRRGISVAKQMAAPVKRFCNDIKLRDWGLWVAGQKHAMDATRHACFWLIFENKRLAEASDTAKCIISDA